MRRFKWLVFVMVALLTILLACAPAAPPVEKEVAVGYFTELTGPIADIAEPIYYGMTDYMKELNEKGGVDGVKIKLIEIDTMYSAKEYPVALKRVLEAGAIVGYTKSSTCVTTMKDTFAREKIPFVSHGMTAAGILPPAWVFLAGPSHPDNLGQFIDWIAMTWKGPGKAKLALITCETSMGKGFMTDYVPKYLAEKGIDFYGEETIPLKPVDTTPQLRRLAAAGVTHTFFTFVAGQWSVVIKDADKLGILDKMVWAVNHGVPLLEMVRLVGPLSEGLVIVHSHPDWGEKDSPAIIEATGWHMKYRGKVLEDSGYFFGAEAGNILEEGLRIALKEVGYEGLTGEAMYNALEKVEFQRPGYPLFSYPNSISSTKRVASVAGRVFQVKGGKVVPITDWTPLHDMVQWKP